MNMTKAEKAQCKEIIQRHASNVGYALAQAMEATTKMTLELAEVFNVPMTEKLAAATAVKALKKIDDNPPSKLFQLLTFPVSMVPIIPSPSIVLVARAKVEWAGWQIAEDFANQRG